MIAYVNELKTIKFKDNFFNIIKKENIEDRKIFSIPIKVNTKQRKLEKITTKLCQTLYKENIKKIIVSNELQKNEIFKEIVNRNRIDILDGKMLYKILLPEIIETICNYKNSQVKEEKISILVNENSEINLNNILDISKKAKSVNIVTNYINNFTKISNYLYDELGILIRVSNNLKKDLSNSTIIINIDFNADSINRYYINTKAIIVNIPENIKIDSKKFAGININSYNIIIPEEYILTDFDNKYIYESVICNKNVLEMLNSIEKDEVKIKNLIGKNGVINKREFLAINY